MQTHRLLWFVCLIGISEAVLANVAAQESDQMGGGPVPAIAHARGVAGDVGDTLAIHANMASEPTTQGRLERHDGQHGLVRRIADGVAALVGQHVVTTILGNAAVGAMIPIKQSVVVFLAAALASLKQLFSRRRIVGTLPRRRSGGDRLDRRGKHHDRIPRSPQAP
ncbi:MAG: hypothetical protein U0132_08230 [Gemmatimonadaceae bacterium]